MIHSGTKRRRILLAFAVIALLTATMNICFRKLDQPTGQSGKIPKSGFSYSDGNEDVMLQTKSRQRLLSEQQKQESEHPLVVAARINLPFSIYRCRVEDFPYVREHYNLNDEKIERLESALRDFQRKTREHIDERIRVVELDGKTFYEYDGDDEFASSMHQHLIDQFHSMAGEPFRDALESYWKRNGYNTMASAAVPFRGQLVLVNTLPIPPFPSNGIVVQFEGEQARPQRDKETGSWHYRWNRCRKPAWGQSLDHFPQTIAEAARIAQATGEIP
jgi:hypothetical protein